MSSEHPSSLILHPFRARHAESSTARARLNTVQLPSSRMNPYCNARNGGDAETYSAREVQRLIGQAVRFHAPHLHGGECEEDQDCADQ